jgi:hypothetical protein
MSWWPPKCTKSELQLGAGGLVYLGGPLVPAAWCSMPSGTLSSRITTLGKWVLLASQMCEPV